MYGDTGNKNENELTIAPAKGESYLEIVLWRP